MQEILVATIAAVTGLISGVIGSLFAPWVHWGVEKRRKRQENRAELVRLWRQVIGERRFSRTDMTRHPSFGVLKPLLSKSAARQLCRPENEVIVVAGKRSVHHADLMLLQTEIARIEREWGLL
jgi:hypothetical protein